MELLRFKQSLIITGPFSNVLSVYNLFHENGVQLDVQLSKSTKDATVLVCVNRSIVKPQFRLMIQQGAVISEEMWEHTPVMYWQTHHWWNYYHNKKLTSSSQFLTLNAWSQSNEIKNIYAIWK